MNKSAPLVDAYLHKGLRVKLVIQLRDKGITDENVLSAIGKIPRHFFLDSAFDKIAYEDRAFPIAADQTISQPYTVAYQTQLLQIIKGFNPIQVCHNYSQELGEFKYKLFMNIINIEHCCNNNKRLLFIF